jgi:glycosyltransferase involved in cell wall biosynthesis
MRGEARRRTPYGRADACVLTPVNVGRAFEGFGIAYLEANAYGKPVVGSLGCDSAEAIEDGVKRAGCRGAASPDVSFAPVEPLASPTGSKLGKGPKQTPV